MRRGAGLMIGVFDGRLVVVLGMFGSFGGLVSLVFV